MDENQVLAVSFFTPSVCSEWYNCEALFVRIRASVAPFDDFVLLVFNTNRLQDETYA